MAKCTVKMPDELLEKLSRLGAESDAIAERVLEVGGDIVVSKVKSNLSAVIGSGVKFDSRSTGEAKAVDSLDYDVMAAMYCDIIRVSTGVAIMTAIDVGNVGSTSYMTPFYCIFDKESKVAKYVWAAGAVTSTSTTYGWLYGCSVNKNGLVWEGIVATPKSERTSYSSEMQAVNYPYRFHCPKGAYVCAFSNTSSSTTACTLGFIVHSGNKMVAKYLEIPSNTEYSNMYSPSSQMVTEDGLLYMYFNKATYKSSTYNIVLVIDIESAKIVKEYTSSTSYTYTLYLSSLLRKGGFLNSQEGSPYIFVGKDENGKAVECRLDYLPSIFKTEQHRPWGSERYKIYPQNSSNWNLYDYKGGFVE